MNVLLSNKAQVVLFNNSRISSYSIRQSPVTRVQSSNNELMVESNVVVSLSMLISHVTTNFFSSILIVPVSSMHKQ